MIIFCILFIFYFIPTLISSKFLKNFYNLENLENPGILCINDEERHFKTHNSIQTFLGDTSLFKKYYVIFVAKGTEIGGKF